MIYPNVEIGESTVIQDGAIVVNDHVKVVSDLVCFKGFYERQYIWRSDPKATVR